MEKAILQTLNYFDCYDYPLRAWEIHKWLIRKSASLREVEKSLNKLIKHKKIQQREGFYFLKGRANTISNRLEWDNRSQRELSVIKIFSPLLKINPKLDGLVHDGESFKNLSSLINGKKDLDSALRILSAKVFWQRSNSYFKLLEKNDWIFKYFPNWVTSA